jgi:eukaryotic-like serine/threonine-protein kinase
MTPCCFGRYILLDKIGSGGMGEVFAAVPRTLWGFEKFFAVKKILPPLCRDPEFLARFRDEARLVIPMNHPNVVQVYEVGRVGEEYFLAMELVDGRNLGRLLARCWRWRHQHRLTVPAALYITRELLTGLEYCHRRTDGAGESLRVVHRDVSPSNVLVSHDGAVKLADFGLASSAHKVVQTRPDLVLGHLGYIAPEALDGRRLDVRADVFSTGVLLFELLTCERFAPGSDPIAVRQQLTTRGRIRPSSLRSDVPTEVDEIVARAVAPSPEDRYPTARAFHDDVQRALVRLEPVYGARELSESVMQTLFDVRRQRQQLLGLLAGLDMDELEESRPSVRTVCLGEAIPLGEAPRRAFGADKAMLTLTDDIFEEDTEPLRLARARASVPRELALPEVRATSRPERRRRRWLTPAPVMRAGVIDPDRRQSRSGPDSGVHRLPKLIKVKT